MSALSDPIVIVGSGLAGYAVAREVRKIDKDVRLVMVTKERGDYYAKPGLSTAFAQRKGPADLVTTAAPEMSAQLDLTIMADTDVLSIDVERRRLRIPGDEIAYGRLVLALGADPVVLPLSGTGVPDVLAVNDLAGYANFRERVHGAKRVLVIGGGLIGCEFANDLLHAGITPVVVDRNALPLASLIPASAGTLVRDRLAAEGVEWRLGANVSTVDRHDVGYRVTLDSGEALDVDLVLSAVGLRPRTGLAKAAGLEVARGIVVDEFARTSAADIFALGDCAEHEGGVLSFVQPILVAARPLARTLLGSPTPIEFPPMPVIIKTPAHPVVVQRPPAAVQGEWHLEESEGGLTLCFKDTSSAVHGFVLTGESTARRAAVTKRLAA
jgi:rubredoxin---NAD+ reductase